MAGRYIFTRTIIATGDAPADVFRSPINGDHNALTYKALLRRSNNYYAVKVGWFGSQGRVGQGLQAVGTALLPGDTSIVRSPVRSTVYSALTPGGLPGVPGVGVPSREERGYRCPEGFQYGGRFTDSRFSTCGQMLFDIFTLGATIGQLVKPVGTPAATARAGGAATPIPGLSPQDQQLIISRAAQIPRVGPENRERRAQAVRDLSKAIVQGDDGVSLMARRDGFMMRPVVSSAILRTVPDNRNMEGATYLTRVRSLDSLGRDELGLLSNTGVTELLYIGNDGVQISMRKTRPLTVGERRKLGKVVVQAAKTDNSDDPTARLQMIVDNAGGGIEYSETFGSIDRPNDIVTVEVGGSKRQMRRWVYDAFVKDAPKKQSGQKPEITETVQTNQTEIKKKITSLAEAVRHLNDGGDPSEVLPSLLPAAMQRTRGYQTSRVDKFTKRHLRAGKHEVLEHTPEFDYEHLSAKVSADIQKLVGLDADNVLIAGSGIRAPYMSVSEARPGEAVKAADNLDNAPPAAVLALAMADFLVDHRDRRAATTQIVTLGGRVYIRSADNKLTLLTGIAKSKFSARQRLGIDDVLNEDRLQYYSSAFRKLTDNQRRLVINELDKILDRLRKFSWEEYIGRLRLDGMLSKAELAHLEIIKSIVQSRLGTLTSSKKRFLQLLSLT